MSKKNPPGHYCKICGRIRANENFSGKGHAAHICKDCQKLPVEKRNELQTINKIMNLPFWLSKEQISWLKKMTKSQNKEIAAVAQEAYTVRFPPKDPRDDYKEVPFIADELEEFMDSLMVLSKDGELEDINTLLSMAAGDIKNALGYLSKAMEDLAGEYISLTPEEEEELFPIDDIGILPFP